MSAVLRDDPRCEPMTGRQLDEVVGIERDVYEFPWTHGNFADSLAAGYAAWTWSDRRGLIGYAVMMRGPAEAHLLNLSVARARQRQGHGSRILEFVIDQARGGGAAALFLEVRPSNAAGRALYARSGFHEVGLRRDYYPAARGREDALVLRIDIA